MIRTFFLSWVLPLGGACIQVETDRLLARHLAAANAVFTDADPQRDMGPAPLTGVRRVFSAEEMTALARRYGMSVKAPLAGACFERSVHLLSEEALLPILTEALAMPAATIELVEYSRYAIPAGTLEFPRAGLGANGFWRGRVVYAEGRSATIWARIRIRDRESGEVVSPAKEHPVGAVRGPKEIERGDAVRVEVSSGGVLLAFQAAAESSGRIGDTVLVKNPSNGRRFQAQVLDKGKVAIRK
jgi:hypothetical protein